MLALQWEPLGFLATVYPRARSKMMQIMAFSALHPNRFIALFSPMSFFYSSKSSTLTTSFYLHHHLCVMAAASNATNATWILLSAGWRLKLGRI